MDLSKGIEKIERSINLHEIKSKYNDYYSDLTYFYMYKLYEYDRLIVKVNRKRMSSNISFQEKTYLLNKYIKIYESAKKMYKVLLDNLIIGELELTYNSELDEHPDYVCKIINQNNSYKHNLPVYDNLVDFMARKIRGRIYEVNDELYKLKNFKYEYLNNSSTFIGPYKPVKYDADIVFYKDVYIAHSGSHHFSVYYNENSEDTTKNTILNILAYLNREPFFYFIDNPSFNRKLDSLYREFDIMDILKLRNAKYLVEDDKESIHIEMPMLKKYKHHNFTVFQDMPHECLFEFYHASLKQFEPLPRCVFLFRIFEYAVNYHYQPIIKPPSLKYEDAIEYYIQKIYSYSFSKQYFIDFGSYVDYRTNEIVKKRKINYLNFDSALKKEMKKIEKEWQCHHYLKNKSLGEIIYQTGRNAVAHGGNGMHNARYDYADNYLHINNVNVFLELIARYVIETLNPEIKNMVEIKKEYYIHYNDYQEIFARDHQKQKE